MIVPSRVPGWAGAVLIVLLALPPLRDILETSMAGHMLVQLPLLVLGGFYGASAIPWRWRTVLETVNGPGLPGILLVLFTSTFWMLPRSLDGALASPAMEMVKFVSLPLLAGIPLALSWSRLHPIARGFILANGLSMLGVLGWLYRQSPVRLCNYYLLDQQVLVGNGLLWIAGLLMLAWIGKVFIGAYPDPQSMSSRH